MVKKKEKGKRGEQTQYYTRAQAIRKLQVTIKDFRRLCILKGIYPREPNKKFKGHNTSYYHVKDIKFLAHEKLLKTFRNMKVYEKKIKKFLARGDKHRAKKYKRDNKPSMELDHLVKERYPSFVDAIRDLDDPLCMLNIFAVLSANKINEIPNEKIQKSIQLVREFQLWVIKAEALRKVFLSIKGIYYQAEIYGQQVTWIQPYQFTQKLPSDVDYKVMQTFLDFYQVMVRFVNFKLYSLINQVYPPRIDNQKESNLYNSFSNFLLETKEQINENQQKLEDEKYKISEEFKKDADVQQITSQESFKGKGLFKNLVFYLNREVPRYSLEFIILSFQGEVHWEGDNSEIDETSKAITHFITDRDPVHLRIIKGREYIQPQWVYDSINNSVLIPTKEYFPGKILPPHLSPFINDEEEGYIPERQKEIKKIKGEEIKAGDSQEEEEEDNNNNNQYEEYDFEEEQRKEEKNEKLQQKEQKKLAESMMTKKQRNLLNKINYGKRLKQAKVSSLISKAKKLKQIK